MSWTTSADLKKQVQKRWNKGDLLRERIEAESGFPVRLALKKPGSSELADHYAEVRNWISELRENARYYRIGWRTVQHRVLGENHLPHEIWVDTLDDALAFIGRKRESELFTDVHELTTRQIPELAPWLVKRPLKALELAREWQQMLDIVSWLKTHPLPGIYLRQVDIPGVHSKMIESRKSILAELFDLALEPNAIIEEFRGITGFCQRYGFKDKPTHIRFRILDQNLALLHGMADQDISVPAELFAEIDIKVEKVYVTENEINFLSFPPKTRSMVVFGSGYGFDSLAKAKWLHERELYYWGDLDTHGFAILDQFRSHFPMARSFLMDRETLEAHRQFWGKEDKPETRELPRLTAEEQSLYNDFRTGTIRKNLRLEQERIGYGWIQNYLANALNP